MPMRLKKLIGMVAILIWLLVYSVIAARIGVDVLPQANWFVELLYYAAAGMGWVVVPMVLIPWMSRPSKSDQARMAAEEG